MLETELQISESRLTHEGSSEMAECSGQIAAVPISAAFPVIPSKAQVLFGTMVGSVTDQSGSAALAATVRVNETSTNESRTAETGDSGRYTVSTVPAGAYQIEITRGCCRGFLASGVVVNQNNAVRVDAQLLVGTQAQRRRDSCLRRRGSHSRTWQISRHGAARLPV